jgi:hypothetical protein
MRLNKTFFVFLVGLVVAMTSGRLSAQSRTFGKDTVFTVTSLLKNDSWFRSEVQRIETVENERARSERFQKLFDDAVRTYRLQQELEWLNMGAIRLAFADMRQSRDFNAAAVQPLMDELEQLVKKDLTEFIV